MQSATLYRQRINKHEGRQQLDTTWLMIKEITLHHNGLTMEGLRRDLALLRDTISLRRNSNSSTISILKTDMDLMIMIMETRTGTLKTIMMAIKT